LAYVEEEHAQIAALAHEAGQEGLQRAALGRLLHTVQDLYAHTNYVALWCRERGGKTWAVNDPTILDHPHLRTAQWSTWRDPLYYVPLVGKLLRRVWLPANSHEAINLDSPKCGVFFHVAVAMAEVRTVAEYARAVAAIREAGGRKALARFHGTLSYPISNHSPLQA
jgi:hypothetical protein